MFHNISRNLIFCSVYVRQSFASARPCDGGNSVENFMPKSLDDNGNRRTFAADIRSPHQGSADGEGKFCLPTLNLLFTMKYNTYDLPSAVTEEGLASMVCASVNESVKDYLSGVTDYVARCQQRVTELEEILDIVTAEKRALEQQVEELKECLATCHAMRSQAMNFNKVGTVVAHADHVTLQYQAS